MPSLEKKKEYTDQAAAAYKAFKDRVERNPAMTRQEKLAKLEMFLDSHVSIFDDYFEAVENHQGRLRGSERIAGDAKEMAKDIAALFGSSATGRFYMRHSNVRNTAQQAQMLDAHGAALLAANGGENNARQSYLAPSVEVFDTMMRRTSLSFDDQDPAVQASIQAAQRRGAWASGPAISQQDEAGAQIAIADARVKVARGNVIQAEQDIHDQQEAVAPLREAVRAAQEELAQAEREAAQDEEQAQNKVPKAGKRKGEEGIFVMTSSSAGPNHQRRIDAARAKANKARADLEQALRQVGALNAALDNANRELDLAQDQLRAARRAANAPEAQRTLRRSDRTEGLNADQMKGIRSISAFLYRNTMHGREATRTDRGKFVDGILQCSPRQKLLMFYLIEKDKIHSTPTRQEILDSQEPQTYIPNLDAFKSHIFGGILKGFFSRATGNSLNWDKLSDVAQSVKGVMPVLYQLLATQAANRDPALAQELAKARPDPELANAIQRVIDAGNIVVRAANPPQAAINDLRTSVDALNAYIASQGKSGAGQLREGAGDAGFWVGYMAKPCSIMSQFLAGSVDAIGATSNTGQVLNTIGTGTTWDANILGGIGFITGFITLLGSIVDLVRTGRSHPGGAAMTLEILNVIRELGAWGSSGYSAASGFANLSGHAFTGSAHLAVGALGGAVGFVTMIVGGARAISAHRKVNALDQYRNDVDRIPTDGLSPAQVRALNEKKQLLKEIAGKQRMSEHRRNVAGRYQAIGGALTAVAGGLTAGGITVFAAAGVSLAALVVGTAGAVHEYRLKGAERVTVVDRYLGIDTIFPDFKRNNTPPGQDFNRLYGPDEEVKELLREECARNLGFTSSDKLFAYIMWRYAQALYQGAFIRNGAVMTARDELGLSQQESEERKLYTDLLKSFGMKVKYPENPGGAPVPDVNAIYKKLMK